jgi:hypothetical protein
MSFIAAFATQSLVDGFDHFGLWGSSFILFVLGLALADFFVLPLFKLLSFSTKGFGGLLIRTILSGLIMYMATSLISGFSVVSTVLPGLRVWDVMLPAKSLSPLESLGASALTYSIITGVLSWLCSGKK